MKNAAAVQPARHAATVPDRAWRAEDVYFSGIALLILGTVFLGFARTYYMAGVNRAPLPSPLVHIHAAVFSAWILLFVAQVALVAAARVKLHKRLGMFGVFLAACMIVLGYLTAADALRRRLAAHAPFAEARFVFDLGVLLLFAILAAWAIRARRDPAAHKRLMTAATIALTTVAVIRWPLGPIQGKAYPTLAVVYLLLLSIPVFDLLSRRRIHRATWWSLAIVILTTQALVLLAGSRFAISVAGFGRIFPG